MSEALYRKYRPQTFDDVVGQTHIERTLKNAIESDKVSHAYLFCGPRGTGKTTTARLLAKALLCEHGPTPSPDGTCEQCEAIAQGLHPDVNELDAASRTGVENVREEIIGRVQYAPTRGRFKIYIIDEVHMLSTAAFNALLKTLEEPPSHVVFILCTTDPQKVPETIHSRCQRFDFHRLSNEEIVSRLGAVCMAEGVDFEGDALDLIAHRAQGGMRDALTTLEQLIAFGNGAVTVDVARSVLGSFDVDDMSSIVASIGNRDAAACFTWMSEYVETGADLAQFARDLAEYVRDLYVLALTDGAVALNAAQSSLPRMAQEAELFGIDRLAYVLRVLGDLNTELRSSSNSRLSFEIALTRMVRPQSDLSLEALAARVEALEARIAAGAVAAPSTVAHDAPVAQAGIPPLSTGYKAAQRQTPNGMAPQEAQAVAPAPSNAAASQAAAGAARPASSTAGAQAVAAAAQPSGASQAAACAQPAAASQSSAHATAAGGAPAAAACPEVAKKLANPAALQRGWQAALADLKRKRAAYGALLLSARVVGLPDGSGIVIEFSKENTFAYSAAQKPDISAALAESLRVAFDADVPFQFAQSQSARVPGMPSPSFASAAASARGAAQPASAPLPGRTGASGQAFAGRVASGQSAVAGFAAQASARPASHEKASVARPSASAQAAPAAKRPFGAAPAAQRGASGAVSARPSAPEGASGASAYRAPWEDEGAPFDPNDVVPYDDADVVPYDDADAASYIADDQPPFDMGGVSAAGANAPSAGGAAAHPSQGLQNPASRAADMAVSGPKPVDPYPVGQKLGFNSMPDPTVRPEGTIDPDGWPMPQPEGSASQTPAQSALSHAPQAGKQPEGPVGQGFPSAPAATSGAAANQGVSAAGAKRAAAASDASEPVPSAASQHAPAPAASSGEEMAIADIFGSFGVSFDEVREER